MVRIIAVFELPKNKRLALFALDCPLKKRTRNSWDCVRLMGYYWCNISKVSD